MESDVKHGRSRLPQGDLSCDSGFNNKKLIYTWNYTYRTRAAIDATFSKTVIALYMVYCLGNVSEVEYVL